MNVVFIYSKDGFVKALDLETSQKFHDELISDGWIHTNTLNPCIWIEYLVNNSFTADDVLAEINCLLNKEL